MRTGLSIVSALVIGAWAGSARAGAITETAPCRFAARISSNEIELYRDPWSTTAMARLGQVPFDVVLDSLSPNLVDARVRIHAVSVTKRRATITLDAFTELASFELRTTRDIAVVADHVWIRRNETITALGAALGRLQIGASDFNWPIATADVACGDVSLGSLPDDPLDRAAFEASFAKLGPGAPRLLVADDATFRDSPDGKIVYRLDQAFDVNDPVVRAFEERKGFTHIVRSGVPFIDAWVESTSLEVPPSYGRIGCGCISHARRLAMPRLENSVSLAVAAPTTLRLAPPAGEEVASLAVSTLLIGYQEVDGFLRVELVDRALMPAPGQSFWVRASDLVSVREVRKRSPP